MRRRHVLTIAMVVGEFTAFAVTAHALTTADPLGTHPVYAALGLPAAWDVTHR